MLGDLLKRVINGAVLFLAAVTFFFVPIGGKTSARHVVAIFSTPPAREAAAAFRGAARQLVARIAGELDRYRRRPPDPRPPS